MRNVFTLRNAAPGIAGQPRIRQAIRAEVVLGSPSSGCNGVGICRVMAQGYGLDCPCPKTAAKLSVTEEGKLRFSFQKSSMSADYLRRHFGWLLFQVTEPCRLPLRITAALQTERRRIEPGVYQVWETNDAMVVDF